MTGLDADDPSFPSKDFQRLQKISVRPSKSFRKVQSSSNSFQKFRPEPRSFKGLSTEFASLRIWPAERAANLRDGARSRAINQHLSAGLTAMRGCEEPAQGRGGFEGSGQGRSPLRLSEHIKNESRSSCQEIVLRGRVEAAPTIRRTHQSFRRLRLYDRNLIVETPVRAFHLSTAIRLSVGRNRPFRSPDTPKSQELDRVAPPPARQKSGRRDM